MPYILDYFDWGHKYIVIIYFFQQILWRIGNGAILKFEFHIMGNLICKQPIFLNISCSFFDITDQSVGKKCISIISL